MKVVFFCFSAPEVMVMFLLFFKARCDDRKQKVWHFFLGIFFLQCLHLKSKLECMMLSDSIMTS